MVGGAGIDRVVVDLSTLRTLDSSAAKDMINALAADAGVRKVAGEERSLEDVPFNVLPILMPVGAAGRGDELGIKRVGSGCCLLRALHHAARPLATCMARAVLCCVQQLKRVSLLTFCPRLLAALALLSSARACKHVVSSSQCDCHPSLRQRLLHGLSCRKVLLRLSCHATPHGSNLLATPWLSSQVLWLCSNPGDCGPDSDIFRSVGCAGPRNECTGRQSNTEFLNSRAFERRCMWTRACS
eukprot:366546-Chlamydomonas_euryale.AAC.19